MWWRWKACDIRSSIIDHEICLECSQAHLVDMSLTYVPGDRIQRGLDFFYTSEANAYSSGKSPAVVLIKYSHIVSPVLLNCIVLH